MAERQTKVNTTGTNPEKPSATYVPVKRGFGLLSSQYDDVPAQQQESSSPMQRWINAQPGESPYHNIGSIANREDTRMQTAKPYSKQQMETPSNQATAGSWWSADLADLAYPTKDEKKEF
ncbi:MAG: hypothetical protein Q9193_003027 [Seirophora villosa]